MKYAILRTQKLKSTVAMRRSMKHAFREQDTPNADPALLLANTHIGANGADEALAKAGDLLPEKRRKDAVLCIEYLVTASPEAMKGKTRSEQDAYLLDSLEWIKERHGASNVIYAGIHRDETTPHLYAYAVPLDPTSGRLNAKRWLGGPRALSEMQTDFAGRVGEQHGLERGIEGSKATHERVKQHYAAIASAPNHVPAIGVDELAIQKLKPETITERLIGVKETQEGVAKRLNAKMQAAFRPLADAAADARTARNKAEDLQRTLRAQQHQAGPYLKALQGLHPADQEKLAQVVKAAGEQLKQQAQERLRMKDAQRAEAERARRNRGR